MEEDTVLGVETAEASLWLSNFLGGQALRINGSILGVASAVLWGLLANLDFVVLLGIDLGGATWCNRLVVDNCVLVNYWARRGNWVVIRLSRGGLLLVLHCVEGRLPLR